MNIKRLLTVTLILILPIAAYFYFEHRRVESLTVDKGLVEFNPPKQLSDMYPPADIAVIQNPDTIDVYWLDVEAFPKEKIHKGPVRLQSVSRKEVIDVLTRVPSYDPNAPVTMCEPIWGAKFILKKGEQEVVVKACFVCGDVEVNNNFSLIPAGAFYPVVKKTFPAFKVTDPY